MENVPTQDEKERTPLLRIIFPLVILIGLTWAIWADASNPVKAESVQPSATQTAPSPTLTSTPVPRQTTATASQPSPTPTVSSQNTISTEEINVRFALIESEVAHHWSWGTELAEGRNAEDERDLNKFEFRQTCDWLNHTKAGETELARRSGLGSGYTTANFEIYLKSCGDAKLEYLSGLKALHPGEEVELKKEFTPSSK